MTASSSASSGMSNSCDISKCTARGRRLHHAARTCDHLDVRAALGELGRVLHGQEAQVRSVARDFEIARGHLRGDLLEQALELDGGLAADVLLDFEEGPRERLMREWFGAHERRVRVEDVDGLRIEIG